jgi:multidrug efflux system membrane fusion protein
MSEATTTDMPGEGQPRADQAPRAGHRRFWWAVLLAAVGGAVLAWVLTSNRKQKAPAAPRPAPVTVAAARTGDINVEVAALGTVTPVYTVDIVSRVQGEILTVNYREGQAVHKGAPLVRIDPRPFDAAVTQAVGTLAHDRGLLAEARIDLKRYRDAWIRNAIPKQQLDDQEQVVVQDEGLVKADEGALATASVNRKYCDINSPIDGRVGLRLVDPGNMVQANSITTLVTVTQMQPITVIFSVAEDYLPEIQAALRRGQSLSVEAWDRAGLKRIAAGTLLTTDNTVDATTGTVRLRASFPNKDEALFPGQFVNAQLKVATQHGVTLVPTGAIQRNAQLAFVYVIDAQKVARMQTVTVGTTEDGSAAVQGVKPGDEVATSGFDKIQPGESVAIREAPDAGPQPPAGPGTDP